jgi:hypothetical protein
MSKHWSDDLPENACGEAVIWARTQESAQQAWDACERGDWMLWLLAKWNANRKKLILAACECARLALKYVPKGEERPLQAIEIAERWAKGQATLKEVESAAAAAYATASAADATTGAAYAAGAAATAADTPRAAIVAAAAAGYAAIGAAAAAAYATASAADAAIGAVRAAGAAATAARVASIVYTAAYTSVLFREAKIVRKYFPKYPKPRKGVEEKGEELTKEQRRKWFNRIVQKVADFCYENKLEDEMVYDNQGKFNHFRIRLKKIRQDSLLKRDR